MALNFSIILLDKTQYVAIFKVLANNNFQIRYESMGIQLNQQQRRSQNHTSGYVPKSHLGKKKKSCFELRILIQKETNPKNSIKKKKQYKESLVKYSCKSFS